MKNDGNEKFVRGTTLRKQFDVSYKQLQHWSEQHDIRFIKTPGGKRLYHYGDILNLLNVPTNTKKEDIIYARVSSSHQKEDLKRQIDFMASQYPNAQIISDVGSGINFKRRGLEQLLERIASGCIEYIYVSDKDRLCRFGSEFVEWLCRRFGTKIVYHYHEETGERELADDLLAITNVFVAKRNGLKSARNKRARQKIKVQKSDAQNDTRMGQSI